MIPYPRSGLKSQLLLGVEALTPNDVPPDHCVRITVVTTPLPLLAWLQAQPHPRKIAWADRNGHSGSAGVGIADEVQLAHMDDLSTTITRIQSRAGQGKYFGGLRFDMAGDSATEWAEFGVGRWVLPAVEFQVESDLAAVHAQFFWREGDDFEAVKSRLMSTISSIEFEIEEDYPEIQMTFAHSTETPPPTGMEGTGDRSSRSDSSRST